ncbi:MAG: hypothetical protein PHG15_11650 [Acinetobacter sp.]|uniref:hypothetical protein n=1 Tax=unclassified Acinetobacter TaxID=196816 RepID=UPI0015D1539F|nr:MULTISPECIES: hypothetical protein [unclassified Acinetobacter]MDD2946411.1 hypothetical protein [Acinetobacter sp.]
MWKNIRILCLLIILLIVAVNAYRDQNQDWSKPIIVMLHPVNADGRAATQHYIQSLNLSELNGAQAYLQQMSAQYRGQPIAIYFQLGRELKRLPPKVPPQATMLDNILWSLKFRFYAWKQHEGADGSPSVTLYLNYYDPQKIKELKHSTALQKGRIGSVNLFASKKQAEQNKIVLVHELLHAFGASDKYDLTTGQPIYPLGYAYPKQQPLFPQAKAELMAGHIPVSQQKSKMPDSLKQTLINEITAIELGWKK